MTSTLTVSADTAPPVVLSDELLNTRRTSNITDDVRCAFRPSQPRAKIREKRWLLLDTEGARGSVSPVVHRSVVHKPR